MNRYSTEPEFTLEQSEKIALMESQPVYLSRTSWDQVVVELRLLSKELNMSVDILGKIRDSVQDLERSVEDI